MSKLLWPNVIARTVDSDDPDVPQFFAQAATNDNEVEVEVNVYWTIPTDGRRPYLVVDILEETDLAVGEDPAIRVRVAHNDGIVYQSFND